MNKQETLEKILNSFKNYYNVKTEDVPEPFEAEAKFSTHDVNYFLSRSAKLFEADTCEYVFFITEETVDLERVIEFDRLAWEEGLSRVDLKEGHKSTDVTLVLIADVIDEKAAKKIKKLSHYKSYCFTLKGWSNYRLIAHEVSTGRNFYNRQGESLKKLFA